MSSGNESPAPFHPPSPGWDALLGGLEPKGEPGALEEALVANGVGPRIRGLLLLGGLVAGAHWVGRGSDLQHCLVHLQAEGQALSSSERHRAHYQGAPASLCDPSSPSMNLMGQQKPELTHSCPAPEMKRGQ